jgi:hypothetical protein
MYRLEADGEEVKVVRALMSGGRIPHSLQVGDPEPDGEHQKNAEDEGGNPVPHGRLLKRPQRIGEPGA